MTAPTLGVLAPEVPLTTWALVAVALLVLAVATVVCVLRARRLDALHRRTDAARAGLADALERRATVALEVGVGEAATAALAAVPGLRTSGAALDACEAAENTLTRRLAAVDRHALPPRLAGELVDAEQLTLLARRVHNDAVRDTLDLRSRRLVRWLKLAGTAPVPAYFEIADPPRPTGPRPATGTDVARLP